MKRLLLACLFPFLAGASMIGLAYGAKEQGRLEAIDRYRKECVGADKTAHRNEFTLLYVDEYRASDCEEAIRMIWGKEQK